MNSFVVFEIFQVDSYRNVYVITGRAYSGTSLRQYSASSWLSPKGLSPKSPYWAWLQQSLQGTSRKSKYLVSWKVPTLPLKQGTIWMVNCQRICLQANISKKITLEKRILKEKDKERRGNGKNWKTEAQKSVNKEKCFEKLSWGRKTNQQRSTKPALR